LASKVTGWNEERLVWISLLRLLRIAVFLGEQAECGSPRPSFADALLVAEVAVRAFDGHVG